VQIADIRYTSKADFAGSALHILHRGTNSIVYLATAQETGLKLLLKAYDIGAHLEDLSLVCDGTLLHHRWMTRLVLFGVAASWVEDNCCSWYVAIHFCEEVLLAFGVTGKMTGSEGQSWQLPKLTSTC